MRKILLSIASLVFLVAPASAADNYQATAGSGLTFAAKDNGSSVYFPRHIMCDNTTTTQCVAVDASGRITALAVQSGTWTVQPGNTANTTPWLQSISQGGNTAIVKAGNTFSGTEQALGVAVTNTLAAVTPGDGITTTAYGTAPASPVIGSPILFNGTTYDRARSGTTTGSMLINGAGTAGSAAGGVVTVQGVASMTPFLSNPGTAANWGIGATAAAVPANAMYTAFNSGGNLVGAAAATPLPTRSGDGTRQVVIHPCEANTQSYAPISITTATTTRIVTPSASNKTYICSLFLTSAAADNIGIVEGTGGTCGTGTAGVIGGTTAANGPNFAANGGVLLQAGGKVSIAQTAGTNVDLCLITSAATPLAGGINYVQAP